MSPSRRSLLGAAWLLSALISVPARATYSLLIADTASGQIGSAGVSCVGRQAVSAISGIAPGFGAVHAQAQSSAAGRDRGVTMLSAGATAEEVISAITAPSFDRLAASRQYGVVTLLGSAAGYTGSSNMPYADDRQAKIGSYLTSYQGNILTSTAVLDQLVDSLRDGAGCDLPETLMRALEAGALGQQGDSRCTPNGIPADSGFLRVVDRAGKQLVSLEVTGRSTGGGAVVGLREQLATWRATHACAATSDAGAPPDLDASAATPGNDGDADARDARAPVLDASSRDARAPVLDASSRDTANDSPSTATPTADLGREDAHVRDAAARATQSKDAGPRPTDSDDEQPVRMSTGDDGCSTTKAPGLSWLFVLSLLFALRRQRSMSLRTQPPEP